MFAFGIVVAAIVDAWRDAKGEGEGEAERDLRESDVLRERAKAAEREARLLEEQREHLAAQEQELAAEGVREAEEIRSADMQTIADRFNRRRGPQ